MDDPKDLGAAIKDYIKKNHESINDFLNTVMAKHMKEVGFGSVISLKKYISEVAAGRLYGTTSAKGKNEQNLMRLSILLWYSDIDANHEIIEGIKKYDPRFHYPPKGYEKNNSQENPGGLESRTT